MTQVSQNVILLALMFIYRLKRLNPGVKGKVGSEFRLLTVALMLGNKCTHPLILANVQIAEADVSQSWTIILIRTRPGLKYLAYLFKRSMLWRLNFSVT